MLNYIRRWNKWRNHCANSGFYKLLVLIGLVRSPTMAFVLLDEEKREYYEALRKVLSKNEE